MVRGQAFSIIMEFADDGDLYQKIVDRKKRKELFEESEIWSVLIQTVVGLRTLHSLNILHRDLKVTVVGCRARTSSSPRLERRSWEISTCRRWRRMDCCIRKLARRIMPVLRCGRISLMTRSRISGRWAA